MQLRQRFDEVKNHSSCIIPPLMESRGSDVAPKLL
jgi:hypothetical protein